MDELRWVLVGVGLAVLAAVYLWSRRRSDDADDEPRDERVEPSLDQASDWQEPDLIDGGVEAPTAPGETGLLFEDLPVPDEGAGEAPPPPSDPGSPERILVVHVRARDAGGFRGRDLVQALEGEGLEYIEPGAYVQMSDQGQTMFTIVNMVEPGTIPNVAVEDFSTRGVTAFMVLPGPGTADTVARMVSTARRLGARLEADVLDEAGSTLTNQRATHMREEVIEFQRRSQIAAQDL